MKTIYTLKTSQMNGTVTMKTDVFSFTTRNLAEKVKNAVDEANKDIAPFSIWQTIDESILYESEDEVPILNKGKQPTNEMDEETEWKMRTDW